MRRIVLLAAAAAAAAPLTVHAEGVPDITPPPQHYMVINIDYWGTVTNVLEGPRRVGETVNGSMRIDLRYAPSDANRDSTEGDYTWNPPCASGCGPEVDAPSRFVTTRGLPVELSSNSHDRVSVADAPDNGNGFGIEDVERGYDANGDFGEFRVRLSAGSAIDSLADFISTDRITRLDFDFQPEPREYAIGEWRSVLAGISSFFKFDVDRLRATPKMCRM